MTIDYQLLLFCCYPYFFFFLYFFFVLSLRLFSVAIAYKRTQRVRRQWSDRNVRELLTWSNWHEWSINLHKGEKKGSKNYYNILCYIFYVLRELTLTSFAYSVIVTCKHVLNDLIGIITAAGGMMEDGWIEDVGRETVNVEDIDINATQQQQILLSFIFLSSWNHFFLSFWELFFFFFLLHMHTQIQNFIYSLLTNDLISLSYFSCDAPNFLSHN